MPAAFEGFSIREYAAKMRSVDVFKCCPFINDDGDGDGDGNKASRMSKEQAESLLPPITVTKFKLWSHELDRIKFNLQSQQDQQETVLLTLTNKESSEEIPANDDPFPQPHAEEEEVDDVVVKPAASVDRCVVHASPREERRVVVRRGGGAKSPKSKAPKKRSIAEIFAVAPPISTVDASTNEEDEVSDNQGEEEERLVDNVKAKRFKKRKKEKSVVLLEENKKIIIKKKKNNKENFCKLKQQTPVIFAKKLYKKVPIDTSDAVTGCERTPNMKFLSTQKRKVAQTSKFIPKQKKAMFTSHSILKNHGGHNSEFCRTEGDSQENTCGFQHSRRHVKFSGKDDILGPKSNENSSFGRNLACDKLASSSEKDQSADSDKEAAPVEIDRMEKDVSVGTDNGNEACSITGRIENPKLLDHVGIPSFLRPRVTSEEKENHLAEKSVPASKVCTTPDDSLHICKQGDLTTAHEPAYAGIPRLITSLEDSCAKDQGITVSRASGSSGKIMDHVVHPIHGLSAVSTKENTGAVFEPTMCNFISNENAQGRVHFLSPSERDRITDHGLYYQSSHPLVDIVGCSYPFQQQRPVTFTERLLGNKFYGLPLNSHGELIQFSSRSGCGLDQLGKSNTVAGSSSSLPAYNRHFLGRELPRDQLNLFPMQSYVRENCSSHFPDRLGVSYFGSGQRPEVHQTDFESRSSQSFHPLHSDPSVFSISSSRCRQFNQVQNENIGRLIPKETSCSMQLNMNQPTMRLMGKDVAVGNSSRQVHGFDQDGKVWMDKEIIAEHCPSSNTLPNSSLKQNFHPSCYPSTTSAKLKESESHSFRSCSEQALQSNLQMKVSEYRFPHPYQKWQSGSGFEHGSHTASRSPSSSLLHFPQPPNSAAMVNGDHNFHAPFISRTESLQVQLFGSQLPVLSTPQITYKHGILRPAETSYKQHPSHFRSAFDFPFLNPECRENVQASWFQNSSKTGLPPWLLHATLPQNPPITAPQVFSNAASKNIHHVMPRKNIFNAPSMHYSSDFSHPHGTRLPVSQTAVLPQYVQVIPEENSIDMSYRNRMNAKDRMKPKPFGSKGLYPCKRSKRLAVDSINPLNIIDLEVQEKSSVVTGLSSSRDFIDEMQSNFRALDLDSSRKQASGLECILNETPHDGFESFRIESSKGEDIGKSGPIKLSAGAKHIIKPIQNVDQDNCRPIHSTIPFFAVTNGCTDPETQKKSTKIYKF